MNENGVFWYFSVVFWNRVLAMVKESVVITLPKSWKNVEGEPWLPRIQEDKEKQIVAKTIKMISKILFLQNVMLYLFAVLL